MKVNENNLNISYNHLTNELFCDVRNKDDIENLKNGIIKDLYIKFEEKVKNVVIKMDDESDIESITINMKKL